MTFLGLKMILFGHFSRLLASFKISFSSLQHPTHDLELTQNPFLGLGHPTDQRTRHGPRSPSPRHAQAK